MDLSPFSPATRSPAERHSDVESDGAVIVYCDDATGERTVLSGPALRGWAARTANLITGSCGLSHGNLAAVVLPPHWQTAAVLLGAWSAGLAVEYQGLATAGLPRLGASAEHPIDVTFAAGDQLFYAPDAPHRYVLHLGRTPTAAPGFRDYLTDARTQSDTYRATRGIRLSDAATPEGTTYSEWGFLAREMAEMFGLRPGDRVLIDAAEHDHPVKWLLAPLSVGASVVLCANLDPGTVKARIQTEGITRVL